MQTQEIRRKKSSDAHYWGIAAGIGVAVALLFWAIYIPMFSTNDDTGMAAIVYGYHGEYESNMVFSNILLGKILTQLLKLCPTLPWYAILQCIVVLCSFVVLEYLLLQSKGLRSAILPTVILIGFFCYDYFCRVQFSQTAGIATISGFLLLFFSIKEDRKTILSIAAIILILVGSMYRFKVFMMCLAPLSGVGLYLFIPHIKARDWKKSARYVIPTLIVFLLCIGLYGIQFRAGKSTPEWNEYTTYNALRSELLDYGFPDYAPNKDLYEKLNISEGDLNMFRCWNFADPEVFNIETMRQLVSVKEKSALNIGDLVTNLTKG